MQQDQVQILQNARSRKQDTQVLRQNIWNSISGHREAADLQAWQPVKLGGQNGSTGKQSGTSERKMGNELHFASFDGTGRVDFLINKSYFVIGKDGIAGGQGDQLHADDQQSTLRNPAGGKRGLSGGILEVLIILL